MPPGPRPSMQTGGVVMHRAGPGSAPGPLFDGEAALVSRAVSSRRREFALGRWCARRSLRSLGFRSVPLLRGAGGEPLWPEGVVGSISHSQGHAIAAVALRGRGPTSLGIDLEAVGRLPADVLGLVATRAERRRLLADHPTDLDGGLLLFSAKEAIYKAWYPLTRRRVGFEDCVVDWDFDAMTFAGRVTSPGTALDFRGGWLVPTGSDRFLVTRAVFGSDDQWSGSGPINSSARS